jgi:hypothetical protein
MCRGRLPRSSLPNGRWAESFADDLNTRRGIVSGRVALLPRSTEIQPHVARIRPSPIPSISSERFERTCRKMTLNHEQVKSLSNEQMECLSPYDI